MMEVITLLFTKSKKRIKLKNGGTCQQLMHLITLIFSHSNGFCGKITD